MKKDLLGFSQRAIFLALLLFFPMVISAQQKFVDNSSGQFITNLKDLFYTTGSWTVNDKGLNNIASGDQFLCSTTKVKDFTYKADATFNARINSAASLMIRGTNDLVNKNMYIANVNALTGEARLFKFQNNAAIDLVSSKKVTLTADNKYHLEVTAIGKHIVFTVNGELVSNTADYTFGGVLGQNDALLEGYAGLLDWNANVTYQNVILTEIDSTTTPQLSKLSISSVDGNVEHNVSYNPDQYVYIAYVSNNTTKINLDYEKLNPASYVSVKNADKQEVSNMGQPVNEGINIFTITPRLGDATLVYRVIVIRRKNPEAYYNEQYRDQNHFSVKEGWSNDPNGMVYFNGEYHLFYQFYTDINWGPMHWAHSVSKDLIHWEELPITFYPDEYGTMFSGSAVVDEENTSGLFLEPDGSKSVKGGMVTIITADGNGERVIIGYSKDGRNFKKHEGVVKDWTEDPLNNNAFRDPKVFRYENKWFMVIAGGPVRIYSSNNLIDWAVESTYPGLDTECPDLYRLPVMQGGQIVEYKWVLSRGGRTYKVGDFKQVSGKYKFVMDSQYTGTGTQNDGIQNFGPDAYAAQTYSLGKFDDYQRVIQTNWMRPYKSDINELKGNLTFNGNFNLQVELTLIKDVNGKYILQQTPIKEYETLRNTANKLSLPSQVVNNEKTKLGFKGQTYEINAEFTPEAGVSEVGFNVRAGADNYTKVGYNIATDNFYIDRSKSGYGANNFFETYTQKSVVAADGKIKLHIYVDRSSVEVFVNNNTMTGAVQIFPKPNCDSLEVFAVGGKAVANIEICPLSTIWTDKAIVTKPLDVLVPSKTVSKYVGDNFSIKADVFPGEVSQSVVWTMATNDILTMSTVGNVATFSAKKTGSVIVKVASASEPTIFKEITITIRENNFVSNLDWTKIPNEWYFDNTFLSGQSTDNSFVFADNRTSTDNYKYELDVEGNTKIVNMIFGSQTTNAYEGSYSVQVISGSNQVRLFDFKNDFTFTSVTSTALKTTGKNHFAISVEGSVISVSVNGVLVINKDIQSTGRVYKNGLFALNVCNGTAKFSNVNYTVVNNIPTRNTILPGNPNIQYMGRIDFSNPDKPLFAYPNVTIKAKFEGTSLDLLLNHYNGSDFADNYFVSIVDGKTPVKFRVTSAQQTYPIAKGLVDGTHTVELIKVTESYCGECEFLGFKTDSAKTLVTPDPLSDLKLEFYGNSITCGYGIEGGVQPASDNSFKAYPSVCARDLNAQYHTISYSGIGVVRGFPSFLMKNMYNRVIALLSYKPFPANNTWKFSNYEPDFVVVALGTNDYNLGFGSGTITATTLKTGISNFINLIRTAHPKAQIICTNSPMIADLKLGNAINEVVTSFNTAGDNKISYFTFKHMLGGGAGGHPGVADGQTNGKELATFIRLVQTSISDVEASNEQFTIYPNPARDLINIKSAIKANSVEISDLSGKIVKSISISLPGEVGVDISQLPKGIYLLSVKNDHKSRCVEKIAKF